MSASGSAVARLMSKNVELGWCRELDEAASEQEAASLIDAFPLAPSGTAQCPLSDAVKLLRRLRLRREHDVRQCC